jgi:hypothetical protein
MHAIGGGAEEGHIHLQGGRGIGYKIENVVDLGNLGGKMRGKSVFKGANDPLALRGAATDARSC